MSVMAADPYLAVPGSDAARLQLLQGAQAFAAHRADLAALWRQSPGASAFESLPLLASCADAAEQEGSLPLLALFERDAGLRSALPLRIQRQLGAKQAVALCAPLGQYCEGLGEPLIAADFDVLCGALANDFGVDLLLLRKVRADSGLAGALAAYPAMILDLQGAPAIDLAAFADFCAYEASFSSNTRRSRRQRRRRLEAQVGPTEFCILAGDQTRPALEAAFGWKAAWLAERGLTSPVLDGGPWQQALRRAAASEFGRVALLSAGGRPLAVELGFLSGGRFTSYLGAFDPGLSAFGVGQEQMLRTIAWCFDQKLAWYDLLAPADPYKWHWTRSEEAVPVLDYAIPLTSIGHGHAFLRRRARPLLRDAMLALPPSVRRAARKGAKPAALVAAALGAGALAVTLE